MKHQLGILLILSAGAAPAEVHTLTLGQVVERALARNPDLVIARLDERQASEQVRAARDPFVPKVFAGSGLAYTYGFPMSIEGSAPSIVEAQVSGALFDRPASHRLAQAREEARGAALDTQGKRDAVVLRTAELYLEAARAARQVEAARSQLQSIEKVAGAVRLRVSEGRELPLEGKRAELDLALARQRLESFAADQSYAERLLAAVVGFDTADRVRTVPAEPLAPPLPGSEEAAVAGSLQDNPEVRRLESSLAAKGFEVKAEKAARLPRLSVVAKYGLFGKFNNYEEYFRRFQRNNALAGVSFEVPLYLGPGPSARAAQAEAEVGKLRTGLSAARGRIALDARRAWQQLGKARSAVEVARLDLDVARENLGVLLARMEEGRAGLREVEAARYLENEKWIAFYDSRYALEVAECRLLHRTGGLLAALTR